MYVSYSVWHSVCWLYEYISIGSPYSLFFSYFDALHLNRPDVTIILGLFTAVYSHLERTPNPKYKLWKTFTII